MFHATQRNSSISHPLTFQCICSPLINNFQKLKELNIDVDWELPRLHQLDNGSQKMSLKLLQKKTQSENIQLSSTIFTEKEQIKIKRNWIKFCEVILLNPLLVCKLDKSSIRDFNNKSIIYCLGSINFQQIFININLVTVLILLMGYDVMMYVPFI